MAWLKRRKNLADRHDITNKEKKNGRRGVVRSARASTEMPISNFNDEYTVVASVDSQRL